MAACFQSLLSFASGICAFLFVIYFLLKRSKSRSTSNRCLLPQAGGALPIIGHMYLLVGSQLTHKTLGAMADKYGPLFTIQLGSHKALVISSWEMARECFTTHDRNFASRPTIAASKLLGYNFAMFGFTPYGPFWREMRKLVTLELLSNRQIDMLKHIRVSEVDTTMKELYQFWIVGKDGALDDGGVLVDMKQWFGFMTHNAAVKMVGGKRYFGTNADCEQGEARRIRKLMRNFVDLFGVFVLSDAIPFLGWLDFRGYEKSMKRTARELDLLVGSWLEEHKQKRFLEKEENKGARDFMDVMINILENAKISGFDPDTINKATCLNLILAGSDTTMVTLTWALSLLLNNPDELKKVQEELDFQVGRDRRLEESDLKNLVYLHAIVKETLRLYPPSPIIGLRSSMEDCTISPGYHVPAGTRLLMNAWKIHRDERIWPEPNRFQPERFLTSHKNTDVKGKSFELIPFGSGRRSCPGSALALNTIQLILASFLHCFYVAKPSEVDVDMTESIGLTNLKTTPLEVYLTPRLHSKKLYGH